MIEDFIFSDELSDQETTELVNALKENTTEFTTLKFVEEVAELQEKLIKFHLKSKEHKPDLKEILDEVGDVVIRSMLFIDRHSSEGFSGTKYVERRIDRKLAKMHEYIKEGKYKGGL